MVLEQIANLSLGVIRVLSSSLSRSAKFFKKAIMLKPNKTFRLSKQTKRFMCTIADPVERNEYKRIMIQAELAAAIAPKREPRDNKGGPKGGLGYSSSANAATPTA